MLFTTRNADYILRVTQAIEAGRMDLNLTDICPECNNLPDIFNDEHGVVAKVPDAFTGPDTTTAWVIIGCEGYWVVNPALIGLDRENWQDWAALPDDVTPGDFGA